MSRVKNQKLRVEYTRENHEICDGAPPKVSMDISQHLFGYDSNNKKSEPIILHYHVSLVLGFCATQSGNHIR